MKRPIIHKDMLIDELIRKYPEVCAVLKTYNMPCDECVLASTSTIENEARLHNISLKELLAELNKAVQKINQ